MNNLSSSRNRESNSKGFIKERGSAKNPSFVHTNNQSKSSKSPYRKKSFITRTKISPKGVIIDSS